MSLKNQMLVSGALNFSPLLVLPVLVSDTLRVGLIRDAVNSAWWHKNEYVYAYIGNAYMWFLLGSCLLCLAVVISAVKNSILPSWGIKNKELESGLARCFSLLVGLSLLCPTIALFSILF